MSFHKENDFNWEGIEKVDYKTASTDGPISFNKTDRHTLVGDGQNTSFHTRYFECDGGGYSSLEKHAHVHVVIAARGKGVVIVDDRHSSLGKTSACKCFRNRAFWFFLHS